MKGFEIMCDDLSEQAQRRFLQFQGLGDSADSDFDTYPIAIAEIEEEVECD